MSDSSEAVDRADLERMLNRLLDASDANGGIFDASEFWEFVTTLAQGRGVAEGLHGAGLEMVVEVTQSPQATFNERQRRAYHIGLMVKLLLDVGRLPGEGSILPGNFSHGAVISDLLSMVDGSSGMGESKPQILYSDRGGEATLRKHARRILVGTVYWRMGQTGQTRDTVWRNLMGDDAEKSRLDQWVKEVGGGSGQFVAAALLAGRLGDTDCPFARPNEELVDIIKLVNEAQRIGRVRPKKVV